MTTSDPVPAETSSAAGGAAALPWGSRARGTVGQLVSSELPEVLAMSDRVLAMYGGRVVAELPHGADHEAVMGVIAGVGRGDEGGEGGALRPGGEMETREVDE